MRVDRIPINLCAACGMACVISTVPNQIEYSRDHTVDVVCKFFQIWNCTNDNRRLYTAYLRTMEEALSTSDMNRPFC